jgi:predicted amidohydrolase YtcJ
MQALHQTSDMPWAEARLGKDRIAGAYAWRSLLDAGAQLCGGSDAPVEAANPLAGFHANVTRCDEHGQPPGGWYPAQRLTRQEALASITSWAAHACFTDSGWGASRDGSRRGRAHRRPAHVPRRLPPCRSRPPSSRGAWLQRARE